MPRKLTLEDERGIEYPLFAIGVEDGSWEREWRVVGEHPDLESVRDVIPRIGAQTWRRALAGWTEPLAGELLYEPEQCFAKVADDLLRCARRDVCAAYDSDACGPHLDFPPCFVANLDDTETRHLVTRLFDYWASGRWICLVPHGET